MYTWAHFDGNITSLHIFLSRHVKSTTYFVVTNPSSPPQIAGSQALSSLRIFISRHTRAHIRSAQHTCVNPRTCFLFPVVPWLTPTGEDYASLYYALTWVCLREEMVALTQLVIFHLLLLSMLLRWSLQEQCWYHLQKQFWEIRFYLSYLKGLESNFIIFFFFPFIKMKKYQCLFSYSVKLRIPITFFWQLTSDPEQHYLTVSALVCLCIMN